MMNQQFLEQQLSEHFTLRTMVATGAAIRLGIDNIPAPGHIDSLRQLCTDILEPLWHRFGTVRIVRAYCSEELSTAMKQQSPVHTTTPVTLVAGTTTPITTRQHTTGRAADIHMASLRQAQRWADYARQQHLPFDTLTIERHMGNGCCLLHISHTTPVTSVTGTNTPARHE